MNWLQGILFGLIAGISEFFPISAPAHKTILKHLMGVSGNDPMLDFVCSIAALLALLMAHKSVLDHIRRDQRLRQRQGRRRSISRTERDMRITKSAAIPMLLLFVVLTYALGNKLPLPVVAAVLFLNGMILFIPSRTLQGNKDARSMSGLDSFVLGIMGGLSALPGFSRLGMQVSYARIRGASTEHAVNWTLLLSIPALIAIAAISLLSVFTGYSNITFSCGFFTYLLVFLGAFVGSYASVFFIKILATKNSLSSFCYYCWGAALFAFIMYLI